VVITAQDGAQRLILCAAIVVDPELPWPGRILLPDQSLPVQNFFWYKNVESFM
jgi:hypothetical protein